MIWRCFIYTTLSISNADSIWEDNFIIVGLLSYFENIYTIFNPPNRELVSFIMIIFGLINKILIKVSFLANSLSGY